MTTLQTYPEAAGPTPAPFESHGGFLGRSSERRAIWRRPDLTLVLAGRAIEGGELKRRLGRLRRRQGSAILVCGEPGVGKTSLIEDLYSHARGVQVLRANGVEAEASLGYSVLADICGPLLEMIERLPEPQAAELSGALALSPAGGLDRFAAYAGALSLLSAAADRKPLLVCVDDALRRSRRCAGSWPPCTSCASAWSRERRCRSCSRSASKRGYLEALEAERTIEA